MANAKVTIAVPVYNEGEYLKKTLQSIKEQTFKDYTCLISDNCSSDKTSDIGREFAQQDERFHYFRQNENVGNVRNLVYLYEKIVTEYMMIFSGHDLIESTFLKETVGILESRDDISLAFSKVTAIWEDDREIRPLNEAEYNFTGESISRYLQSVATLANCTLTQGVFRKKHVEDFQFGVICPGPDHILISHLLWYGNVYYHDEYLYKRRFFQKREATQMKRLTGKELQSDYLLMYNAYLEDFNSLYKGDEKYRQFLNYKITDLLTQRFGLDCLGDNYTA